MGRSLASADPRTTGWDEAVLVRFARLMRARFGARVYLFGSRLRGSARQDSDYDLVAVGRAFGEQHILRRAPERGELWREAGGWGIGLDLHCYSPEEFREELSGLGYLGQAKRRGELISIKTTLAGQKAKLARGDSPSPN